MLIPARFEKKTYTIHTTSTFFLFNFWSLWMKGSVSILLSTCILSISTSCWISESDLSSLNFRSVISISWYFFCLPSSCGDFVMKKSDTVQRELNTSIATLVIIQLKMEILSGLGSSLYSSWKVYKKIRWLKGDIKGDMKEMLNFDSKYYWQARGQGPIQIPKPRTWAVTEILWATHHHPTTPKLFEGLGGSTWFR